MSTNQENITIKINGKEIPLNLFASNIIYNAILGMIGSLKLDETPEIIEITLNK